jgi:dihydrofolate synthase / folylpolyglutamate synthase
MEKANTFELIIKNLISIPKFGNGIGLHRMEYLCSEIINSTWSKQLDPINVVGSNGKGSTTSIIADILINLGITTGKYTSPHLFEFSERIQINGNKISIPDLETFYEFYLTKQTNYNTIYPVDIIGAFEAFTFICLNYFFSNNVNAIVLEAGIGGRFDSTRILTGNYSALTSIDLEHTNILGSTPEAIAFDKMDIAKEGSSIILGNLEKDLVRKIQSYARYKNINLFDINENSKLERVEILETQMNLDFNIEDLSFTEIQSNLIGFHQINNILVATLLVKKWLARNHPEKTNYDLIEATRKALREISWPGRLQRVRTNPNIYIDVGHTPDAIRQLVKSFLQFKKQKCLIILGVSFDKDASQIIKELMILADTVVCSRAYHKGADINDIYKLVNENNIDKIPIFKYERIGDAIDFGIDYASKNDMSILIGGGLFISIEAFHYIKGNNPNELLFF